MSENDDLSPDERRMVDFYNKVMAELQTLSLSAHGDVIGPDKAVAEFVFWGKVMETHFADLVPFAGMVMGLITVRGDRVDPGQEESVKKRYLN